jgi:Tfp pilus assembly protein PilV
VRRGLTLLEVLLGNFMLLIVILAAFALLAGTLRVGESSEKALQAESYAQSFLERSRAKPPEELPSGTVPAAVYGDFTVRGQVSEVSGFDPDQLKLVSVEVRWSDRVLRRSVRVCGLEDR